MGKFETFVEVEAFYDMISSNTLTNRGPCGTCTEYAKAKCDTNDYVQTSRTINGRKIHARVHTVALLKKNEHL